MKNIKACHQLGIRTVLIQEEFGGEAADIGDRADAKDPAVNVVLRDISKMKDMIPELWQGHFPSTRGVAKL